MEAKFKSEQNVTFFLQTGTDYFVSGDFGKFPFRVDLSYSGLMHFFFLAFIHLSSRPPPWPFPRIEFLSLFAADVLLICLWFFTPPPTHVLLTYLWFGSEIDVGWNDTHFTAPENKAKNWTTSEKRVHENESLVALQVSPESDSSGFICSRETLNHSSLAEKPPQSVFHS